jgi:hypothetical protein
VHAADHEAELAVLDDPQRLDAVDAGCAGEVDGARRDDRERVQPGVRRTGADGLVGGVVDAAGRRRCLALRPWLRRLDAALALLLGRLGGCLRSRLGGSLGLRSQRTVDDRARELVGELGTRSRRRLLQRLGKHARCHVGGEIVDEPSMPTHERCSCPSPDSRAASR